MASARPEPARETLLRVTPRRDSGQAGPTGDAPVISRMSHDLRTPVSTIMGVFQLLQTGLPPEKAGTMAETGHRATLQLVLLMENFISLVRSASGGLRLSLQAQAVEAVSQRWMRILADARHRTGRTDVEARVDIVDHADGTLVADPVYLDQIVQNLVQNALEQKESKTVTISISSGNSGKILVDVSDNGGGVAAKDASRLFNRGQWTEATDGRVRVGLPLSHLLARLMGMDLVLHRSDKNGSTFRLSIPSAAPV